MRNLPDCARAELQSRFKLQSLDVIPYPGFTTEQLIGANGVIHDLLKRSNITQVFLCSGANDFNKCQGVTSERDDPL